MANIQLRESLFHSHLADLRDVVPTVQDTFVCPICMGKFLQADLETHLTGGHVWPVGIRQKSGSTLATEQRVLLCQQCNSMAGTRGDKQMQLREKIKEGEMSGDLHGERQVQLLLSPNEEPIRLRSRITRATDDLRVRFNFELDTKRMQWARNNPHEQHRFTIWGESGEAAQAVLIQPHHEHRHDLAMVGWITSAYLYAFYTFGYRYILHQGLNPVREYILRSFENTLPEWLELPESVGLHECTEHYFAEPEIALLIPLDEKSLVHLQISFLDYHIRLPFHFEQEVLHALILGQPDIAEALPEIMGQEEANLYCPVSCNKLDAHDCKWDYVLGKPIPDT